MEVRNPLDQNNQSVNITRPESRAVKAVKLDIVQTLSYTAVPYLGQAVGGGFLFWVHSMSVSTIKHGMVIRIKNRQKS